MRFFRCSVLIWLTLTASVCAQSAAPVIVTAPSAEEIVRRAIANDELRRQHRLALECDLTITTERLDSSGNVFKAKTVHVVHRDGRGPAYPVDVDTGPPSRAERDGDTVKAQRNMAAMNLRRLAPRFRYALAGEENVRGRACYVVAFSPKGSQPADTRDEKVINNLCGRYWIDKNTSEILLGEGSLAGPVTVAMVASVTRTDFRLRTQTLPNGEVGPLEFDLEVSVNAPFHFFHQRQTNRLTNWRPR